MINLVEAILMGVWATLFMDLSATVLGRMKVIRPPVSGQLVGRWTLYTLRGKLKHEDIRKTPALEYEKLAALLSHYLIGIVLAAVYLFLEWQVSDIREHVWMSVIFGLATVVLPWFWLYPSMGLGFLASKAQGRSPYVVTSLVNHTDFGLGLFVWIVVFRRFLI